MSLAGETTGLESESLADYGTNSHQAVGGAAASGKAEDAADSSSILQASVEDERKLLNPIQPTQGQSTSPLPSPSIGSVNDRVAISPGHPLTASGAGDAGRSRATEPHRPKKESQFKAWLLKVGPSWFANTDIQKNHKLILIASFFCVFGCALCAIGAALTSQPPHALYNLVFLIGGFVILVPGVYYVVYVIRAYKGHDGYAFENLPPMD